MDNYKKKCKELEFLIKNLYPTMSDYQKKKVEGIFPELRDTEDERIRKKLIKFVRAWKDKAKDYTSSQVLWTTDEEDIDNILSWLEKQKERSGLTKEIIAWLKSLKDRVQPKH